MLKQKRKKKNAGAFAGVLLLLGIFFSPMAAASGVEVSAQARWYSQRTRELFCLKKMPTQSAHGKHH